MLGLVEQVLRGRLHRPGQCARCQCLADVADAVDDRDLAADGRSKVNGAVWQRLPAFGDAALDMAVRDVHAGIVEAVVGQVEKPPHEPAPALLGQPPVPNLAPLLTGRTHQLRLALVRPAFADAAFFQLAPLVDLAALLPKDQILLLESG